MTDNELRIELAERLGWKEIREQDYCEYNVNPYEGPVLQYWQGVNPEDGQKQELPSLSELVATGEGRLTAAQQGDYAYVMEGLTGWDEYSLTAQFRLITAPAAVRARALLEVLPK